MGAHAVVSLGGLPNAATPAYEPDDLGEQGPAYREYLTSQEV